MSVTDEKDRLAFCRTAEQFGAGIMSVVPRDEDDVPLGAVFAVSDENLAPLRGALADAGIPSELHAGVIEGYSVVELDGKNAVAGVPIVEAWQATLE